MTVHPHDDPSVINRFFVEGRVPRFPARLGRREMILREILRRLPLSDAVLERDLNDLIEPIHADYCAVRRAFVDMGYMTREAGLYRLTDSGREVRAS